MNELKHLAIICDGNGRWAQKRGLDRSAGHEAGLHRLEDVTRWCDEFGIPYLSAYVFSLDNWKRPKEETDRLFELAEQYFEQWPQFVKNNVRVLVSGVTDGVKQSALEKMAILEEKTKDCTGLTLNLCANYSGRREIVEAIKQGARTEEEISAAMFRCLPEPDLILRTGGHQRLSDFLLWQSAYAELAFTETLFPDLSKGELAFHIKRFGHELRNRGGVSA